MMISRIAFFFICFLSIAHAALAKPLAQQSQEPNVLPAVCQTLIENAHAEDFRAAYLPLASKKDLLILVDKTHGLPPHYEPADLVGFGRERLRAEACSWLRKMQRDARKEGITLVPVSGYRSYKYQTYLKKRTINPDEVADPGYSQHQLGTAVDFNTVNVNDENLPALRWLKEHAGEYGFSLSFPKGEEAETGYPYEPWHYRYITKEGVVLQDKFFGGSQHKMLVFLNTCLWNDKPLLPGAPSTK